MLVNQILGGQFTSRLNEKLREERGFTYGVRSHFDCRLGRGPFSITTSLQSDKLAEALDDIHHELLALVGGRPPTQAELDDARRALIEGQTRQFETPAALVNRYANLLIHGLPTDHYAAFPDGWRGSISTRLSAAHTGRSTPTRWSPWSSPTRPGRRVSEALEWAELEIIED